MTQNTGDKNKAASTMREAVVPLLEWFGTHARRMPWRDDPSPYHVWLSEIMLQQTRVEAVRGYYERFLEALPDIKSLAGAEEAALLKLWEGLGYYNRVKNLQKAAKIVMEKYGGRLPGDYDSLLKLPGVGEYTAGAIASIAFGLPVPAVDGNVLRVMARLLEDGGDIADPATKRKFRGILAGTIPQERPGDFTQALMELGATVCVPGGTPECGMCPLARICGARRAGRAGELPVKRAKKTRRREQRTIVLLIADGRLLLFRREKGLLAGLYEPLNLEGCLDCESVLAAVSAFGCKPDQIRFLGEAIHAFSHVEWHMRGYLVRTEVFSSEKGVWAGVREVREGFAVPSAFRAFIKNLDALLAEK